MRPYIPITAAAYDLLRQACELGIEEALHVRDNTIDISPTTPLGTAITKYHRYGTKFLPQVKTELDRALQDPAILRIIQRGGTARYELHDMQELARYADQVFE